VNKTGLEDPFYWCQKICSNKANWQFSFHQWKFKEPIEKGTICIYDVHTNLPKGSEIPQNPHVELLGGEQVLPLGSGGIQKFSVTFSVDPHPSKVIGLKKFIAEVISKEEGRTSYTRKKTVWADSKLQKTLTFDRLNKVTLNEGWHFIRILAYTDDNELIPLVDEKDINIPWEGSELTSERHLPNTSDVFYVLPDGEAPEAPPQRAVQLYSSLMHAKWELFFSSVQQGKEIRENPPSVEWSERKANVHISEPDLLAIRYPPHQKIHVPVYPFLKKFEEKILRSPDGPVSWKLNIDPSKVGELESGYSDFPKYSNTSAFLMAREKYFSTIISGEKGLVSQGIDFNKIKSETTEYAVSYYQLMQEIKNLVESEQISLQQGIKDLQALLCCDCITVTIRDNVGQDRKAILVSPTHPLRALWLTVWASLGNHWLEKCQQGQQDRAWDTYNSLIKSFSNIHFPTVIPSADSGLMIVIDNLNHFWSMYGSSEESDPRGLFSIVCISLGLPDPGFSGSLIDGEYLSSRIERYLLQHPYITTLTLNVFNPGRANLISDALLSLQSKKEFADLRYDIRLYSHNPESTETGESLLEFVSPSSSVTKTEAEDFAKPTESHLRPKLALAVKNIEEYLEAPQKHSAHISIVIDLFPPEKVGAIKPSHREIVSPVHGLLQDFRTHFDQNAILWKRYPRHGLPSPIPDNEEYVQLLSMLSYAISNTASLVVTSKPGISLIPLVSLTLDEKRRALLHQMHEASDWVISIDRNMGIEFFDHGIKDNRPDYLIDHSPDVTSYFGHRLFITSRSIDEIEAMVSPILIKYGLPNESDHVLTILNQLRFLSGRLALKLVSSPNQQAEALGLALSRLYLEYQGVFQDHIVIPLDAHQDLFLERKSNEIDIDTEVSFKRTDLALFDLNPKTKTITCCLVEVKCYSSVGDLGAYNTLKKHIQEQLEQSEHVLSSHFKIATPEKDRPDRLLKTKELVILLEFYLSRAERYGIISSEAADEARLMLEILEDGYQIEFTKSAIIFDFQKTGTEEPDIESNIEYHRIGVDLVKILIEQGSKINLTNPSSDDETFVKTMKSESDYIVQIIPKHPSLPALKKAAFISPMRERTVDWDQLKDDSIETTRSLKRIQVSIPEPVIKPEPVKDHDNFEHGVELETSREIETTHKKPEVVNKKRLIIEESPIITPSLPQTLKNIESIPEIPQINLGSPIYDVLLGVTQQPSPQLGIIGELSGRKIALDLNQTHTISLFGVQGGGKSYTLGSIVEMATMPIPNINILPQPLATIIFHYSSTMDYAPEFTSMKDPNADSNQIQLLKERYGAIPQQLSDVILLVPKGKLHERTKEFPDIVTLPLRFSASEIKARDWRFLMGAVGSQALYIRQMNILMKGLRDQLTLDGIRAGVENSSLSDHLKDLARTRLNLAAEYIDDTANLSSLIRPGRLIIVDLRDEFMEKDEALGLFVVLLQLCSDAKFEGKAFNKLVVFDEAHKYIENQDLVSGLIEVVREMRHKGTSILVASQDPPSVPISLIELSSQIILHKFNSPAWLKHIQKANTSLQNLSPEKMSQLQAGEAYVWSSKATDIAFTKDAIKIKLRPRVTKHGGMTKTAIES